MRVVRVVEEEYSDEQERSQAEKCEYDGRALIVFVVDVHHQHHGCYAGGRPAELAQQETVGRSEALLGHDGRGAEDHYESDEDEKQDDGEKPFVDTDAFGHLAIASGVLQLARLHLPDKILEHATTMFVA